MATEHEDLLLHSAEWAATQFERRTRHIAANAPGINVYWVNADSRVSWHEVSAFADGLIKGPDDRVAFQPLFESFLRRRHLLAVLKRRMSATAWVEKFGPRYLHPRWGRTVCTICERSYDAAPGTIFCAQYHGICGVCQEPRTGCICPSTTIAD